MRVLVACEARGLVTGQPIGRPKRERPHGPDRGLGALLVPSPAGLTSKASERSLPLSRKHTEPDAEAERERNQNRQICLEGDQRSGVASTAAGSVMPFALTAMTHGAATCCPLKCQGRIGWPTLSTSLTLAGI